jgi:mannose-1-phosphate guanylyltransferase
LIFALKYFGVAQSKGRDSTRKCQPTADALRNVSESKRETQILNSKDSNSYCRKAFLLGAGLGTRLRPLTDSVPKCLMPIGGRPLLNIWLELCEGLGIEEVLINTHYRAEQVERWVATQHSPVRIRLAYEPRLLGSAGTVAAHRDFVAGTGSFFIFYADNLVRSDLRLLAEFHAGHQGAITLGLFRASCPSECGIVSLDKTGLITNFEEKPSKPASDLANAGIFVAREEIFGLLPANRGFADFGLDVLPQLLGKMYGRLLSGYLIDIGTPENYRRAQVEWSGLARTSRTTLQAADAPQQRVWVR